MSERSGPPVPPEESPLWRSLGITPAFEDEAKAPAVDLEKVRLYYRGELDEAESRQVRLLAGRFRTWYMALGEVVCDRGLSAD